MSFISCIVYYLLSCKVHSRPNARAKLHATRTRAGRARGTRLRNSSIRELHGSDLLAILIAKRLTFQGTKDSRRCLTLSRIDASANWVETYFITEVSLAPISCVFFFFCCGCNFMQRNCKTN